MNKNKLVTYRLILFPLILFPLFTSCASKEINHINENLKQRDQFVEMNKNEVENIILNLKKKTNTNVDSILDMNIRDIANLIRERKISSLELTALYLKNSFDLNSNYNAIVTYNPNILEQAKNRDQAQKEGKILRPLHGIPFTIKDTFKTKNLRTTAGSIKYSEFVPSADAVVVERLLSAGAILLGKTNTPSMAMDVQTSNLVFGTTENSQVRGFSAGGSSGGAAVSVAKKFSAFDIGSDIAGSIRIPAAFNKVYGFRPTYGYTSLIGHIPPALEEINGIRKMAVSGPLAKNLDDIELVFKIIAGPSENDQKLYPLIPSDKSARKIKNLKIAWTNEMGGIKASHDITQALERLMKLLEKEDYSISKNSPKDFPYEKAWESWGAILGHQGNYKISNFKRYLGDLFTRSDVASMPTQRKIVGPISVASYMENLAVQDEVINKLENFLSDYDVWIVPVTATNVFKHRAPDRFFGDFPVYDKPILVDGKSLPYWSAIISYTTIFSLTESPVVTIPIGIDTNGLPIGIQIIGKRFSDLELIEISKIFDKIIKKNNLY